MAYIPNPIASASNGSFQFTTLGFSNGNGVTFGSSAGSIISASHNGLTTAAATNHSHGNPTLNLTNLSGTTASASNGFTLSLSANAPGAAVEANAHQLAGNTLGNSTATGSTIQFIGGNNITLSGTNGSQIRIDGKLDVTESRYNEFKESPMVAGQIGNATLHLQPWIIPNLQFDRIVQHVQLSNASNSSNSLTQSNWVGIYTRNASTLSLLHSVSTSFGFTASGTAGSYSNFGGIRAVTAGLTQTLTEGMYWIGVLSRTSANAGGQTLNQMLNSNVNSTYSGLMGVVSNATNQWSLGLGGYTATTTAMPSSIAFTQINGQSSIFLRPPSLYFVDGTI